MRLWLKSRAHRRLEAEHLARGDLVELWQKLFWASIVANGPLTLTPELRKQMDNPNGITISSRPDPEHTAVIYMVETHAPLPEDSPNDRAPVPPARRYS